jgi:excisionase family DNA binding protein
MSGKKNRAEGIEGQGKRVVAADTGLLDMNQAIELLKTSRPSFYRWVRAGRIKGAKVGRQWRFTRQELDRFLKGQDPVVAVTADIKPLLQTLSECLAACGIDKPPQDADGVLQAVSSMILLGVAMKASDLHIIPTLDSAGRNVVELRYRVDGVLHTMATLDPRLLAPVVERWKRMANCNTLENRLPQDGRIQVNIRQKEYDLRISFLPLCKGESVTARVLSHGTVSLDLDGFGYSATVRTKIDRALQAHAGLVLVTGPMGCGKTTTLYACVKRLTSPAVKIIAIEDPVEYLMPGVAQVQILPAIGLSFAAALRASLRAAPNVLLIGEIRDKETLAVAQNCALTGHLVLSALHTEDAVGALIRMVAIGTPAFLVGDSTRLVVAQRLVRRLCPACSKPGIPPEHILERAEQIVRRGGMDWAALVKRFRDPVGCAACNQTGYRGRLVIAEALEMSPELARALGRNAPPEELTGLAVQQGLVPLVLDGLQRAAAGETTVAEVLRVVS